MKVYEKIKTFNVDEMATYFSEIILDTKDMILKRKIFPSKETLTQQIKDVLNEETKSK